ncbi:MAG TPA: DUF2946 family protein [Rhizomicrobium sp.]|nr:DUF2946 family protein [Rhizomicrobium sp.]
MWGIARHLALVALVLRALVPAGWMPGTTAAAPFVICSVTGPAQYAPGGHKPAQDDRSHHDVCPFAAAPHFAKTLALSSLAAPSLRIFTPSRLVAVSRPARIARYQPQSPRAPPTSV